MAKKPETKTPAAPKEAKAPAADAAAPKAEATATDAAPSSDAAAPAKKSSGASRPISYFSSVSTDEYRAGWADIFGKSGAKPERKAKAHGKLPATLELDLENLDATARDHIEALFRTQAKKKRLNYDKLAANDQVTLRISCIISE